VSDITKDEQFERYTVARVDEQAIHFEEGSSLWVEKGHDIQPGDVVRLYGRGFGFPVRGVAVERLRVVRYETEADWRARMDREQAEKEAKDIAAFKADTEARNGRIALLPEVLQRRIARLMDADTEKRPWSWLDYELFVCEQAVVIDRELPQGNAIDHIARFKALTWDEQKATVPSLSDGHSGNTFGAACALAHYMRQSRIDGSNSPVNMIGALAVLGGPR
jgi:hypothetical protein